MKGELAANTAMFNSPGNALIRRHIEGMERSIALCPPSPRAASTAGSSSGTTEEPPSTPLRDGGGGGGGTEQRETDQTEAGNPPVLAPLQTGEQARSMDEAVDEGMQGETGVTREAAVQELIACKMLLARVATELQEEKHFVSALSAQNQKYAMRVS
jgi:hypothetical protein